jgi:hypothetical protein
MYIIGHNVDSELMMSSVQLMGQSELSTVLITVLTSRDCVPATATWKVGLTDVVTDAGRLIGEKYRKS